MYWLIHSSCRTCSSRSNLWQAFNFHFDSFSFILIPDRDIWFRGHQHAGNDLLHRRCPYISVSTCLYRFCQPMCIANTQCQVATYNTATKNCWLQYKIEQKRILYPQHMYVFFRRCPEAAAAVAAPGELIIIIIIIASSYIALYIAFGNLRALYIE